MERMNKETEKIIKSISMYLPFREIFIERLIENIAEIKEIAWRIQMQDVQVALPVLGGDDAI